MDRFVYWLLALVACTVLTCSTYEAANINLWYVPDSLFEPGSTSGTAYVRFFTRAEGPFTGAGGVLTYRQAPMGLTPDAQGGPTLMFRVAPTHAQRALLFIDGTITVAVFLAYLSIAWLVWRLRRRLPRLKALWPRRFQKAS